MKLVVGLALGMGLAFCSCGCGESKSPPPKPPGRTPLRPPATSPATAPTQPATASAPAADPPGTRPATQPAETLDSKLARVLAQAEATEFFEAMKACRELLAAYPGHARSGELRALMQRLKEYRRDSAEVADAVRKLGAAAGPARKVAAETLLSAGPLGGIYLRQAVRQGSDAVVAGAAGVLARTRDASAVPLLLDKLRPGPPPAVETALLEAMKGLLGVTDAPILRQACQAVLDDAGFQRTAWLDYLAAAVRQRCGGEPKGLDKLVGIAGAHEKLKAYVQAALGSKDPAVRARARRHAPALGVAVAGGDLLVWLRAEEGVQLNDQQRVTRWIDQSPAGNDAEHSESGAHPKLGPLTRLRHPTVRWDGINDYQALPPGFADLRKGITIALWAYPTSQGYWARFVELGNGKEKDNVVFARKEASAALAFHMWTPPRGMVMVTADGAIELNKWQHFAVTQNAAGNVVLYKNGRKIASGTIPADTRAVPRKINYLGRSSWGGNDAFYEGSMDDIRIYDRALTAAEIAAVHKGSSAER